MLCALSVTKHQIYVKFLDAQDVVTLLFYLNLLPHKYTKYKSPIKVIDSARSLLIFLQVGLLFPLQMGVPSEILDIH